MTLPLVTFGDPEAEMVDYLKTAYASRSESFKPAKVTTEPPVKLSGATHVQVEMDGTPSDVYPAGEFATVRFTCHAPAGRRGDVKALASLTQGLAYRFPGSAGVAGAFPLVGRSAVIVDPSTKNLMVWFTCQVTLRPTPAAS